jgi:murein DD-endopeptidase MepM/ murein hydrolase activator NlpD
VKFPYLLYQQGLKHAPIFEGLEGDPYVADLSAANPLLDNIDVRDQRAYQRLLDEAMAPDFRWGFSGYLENRRSLLRDCPQMVEEGRFFHLGLDIIVPKGTAVCAPLDAEVAETGYEEGEGNYGGFVLLRHRSERFATFYSFFGHLDSDRLPAPASTLSAGDRFAFIGDFHQNGNWFYHTHLQVITERGVTEGYLSKGYCAAGDLPEINELCPSPVPLFRR